MFITQKHLSRRTVLRGIGATVALPFLDAMVPAAKQLRKTAAVRKPRLAAIEMVHGAAGSSVEGLEKHYWSPIKEGRDFDFSLSLSPLEPLRDYVTIISDTDLVNAESASAPEVGGDHNRSSSVFLTAARPRQTEGSDIFSGVSMDQIYAQKFGQDTPLPSIQLCIENVGSISGACGYGYSCVYSTAISWAAPNRPFPSERDPRVVFERLFGHGATESERTLRRRQNLTVLDAIRDRISRIQRELGPSDRDRLGEYLESVGEIERRLQNVERQNLNAEAARTARRAHWSAGFVRRAYEADVRSAGPGICDRDDPRVELQDGPRRQRTCLPGKRRADAVSCLIASWRQINVHRRVCQAQPLSRRDRGVFPGEASEHAGRRWEPARSYAGALR